MAFGSKAHSCLPVSASSATTRLYIVLTYSTSSIINGVFWKFPGLVPNEATASSEGFHSHAIASRETVSRFTSASGE
jgi:hypothetical protein